MPSPRIRTIYVDAHHRHGEEHVHVTLRMGWAYGQPTVPHALGYGPEVRDDASTAGTFILHDHEWLPWIKALAVGGHATGVRVLWSEHVRDRRSLWNAHALHPAITGTVEAVPWERADA